MKLQLSLFWLLFVVCQSAKVPDIAKRSNIGGNSVYPEVCSPPGQDNYVKWTGMVWWMFNTVTQFIEPLDTINKLSSICKEISDAWSGGDESTHVNDCIIEMVSEAINGEILSEVQGAMNKISIEVGNLNKYIGTIGDVMSDDDLRNVRGYYRTIKDQIGSISRKYSPAPEIVKKKEESMVYSYTGALMIQAHAAVTISSLVKNKMPDPNTVVSELNFFTTEIQTILEHEYGTGADSIKSILDKSAFKTTWPSQIVRYENYHCRWNNFIANCDGNADCGTNDNYRGGLLVDSCWDGCSGNGHLYQCVYGCNCQGIFNKAVAYIEVTWNEMDQIIAHGKAFEQSALNALNSLK